MRPLQWLAAADGTVWLIQHTADFRLQARRYDNGTLGPVEFDAEADGGADAVLDSEGQPWVVWSRDLPDEAFVYAAQCENGTWGQRLQITTHGRNYEPTIAADEYGNVWIFWFRTGEPGEIRVCRMGRRSGQETLVVRDADGGPTSVLVVRGRLLVTFFRSNDYWLVEGTEHGGFGEPVRI